jgi:CDP-diacylglycerol--glycerol-3-phosphate 3-phosphatidyltransferase
MATATREPSVFNLPNELTLARLVLGVVLFGLIEWGRALGDAAAGVWVACIVVFALAAATDWLDGYVARLQGLVTSLGRQLDPLVDKVVVCGAYIFLLPMEARTGLSAWMVTVVVGRELIITGVRNFLESGGARFGADWLGKVKMTLQCATLFAIFVVLMGGAEPSAVLVWIRDILLYLMVAATVLSGVQYLWRAAWMMKKEP